MHFSVEPYKAVVMLETANMGAIHVTFKAQSARVSCRDISRLNTMSLHMLFSDFADY
jgi:hypothetical protein